MAITWTDGQLAGLKVDDGFRLRGGEITRLESLTDGAFALALTFLVIVQQEVPTSFAEMLEAFRQVPAFAASFGVLILFWSSHVRWSRRYGLEDARAVALSCVMVFTVLVFVYPLKIVFGAFLASITGGWLPTRMKFTSFEELRELFIAYSVGFVALELCLWGLYADALRRSGALRLNRLERFDTRASARNHLISLAIASGALLLALLLPPRWSPLSGYAFGVLMVTSPLYWRGVQARRRRLPAEGGA
jgi:hypothetical protein